jgi:oligoribonuclease NrnB/cAMP/cGMP phosphodiesterase (DHH superfamily)
VKGEFDMSLADGATVFVVDFCFEPHDRMVELQKHAKILFWLDHHKTAIDGCLALGLKFPGLQTVGKAAIELTWNFLHPDEPLPEIVRYIAEHDLWQHDDPSTWPVHYGLGAYGLNPENSELWLRLIQNTDNMLDGIIRKGLKTAAAITKSNAIYAEQTAYSIRLPNGWSAIPANKGVSGSAVFDSVYDPDIHDVKLVWYWQKTHWKFSLFYDKDGFDCGAFAATLGGGGHVRAAGFYLSVLLDRVLDGIGLDLGT